jgi:dienelactone hydrolase
MIHTYQRRNYRFQQKCATNTDWQMIYYANAVHGFTNPEYGNDNSKGAAYNEKLPNVHLNI